MDTAEAENRKKKFRRRAMRLPARASLWYTAASLTVRGISFALTPLFTRILNASEYGIYPLYTGWMSLFSAVMTFDIGGAALYGGLSQSGNGARGFTKSALIALFSVFFAALFPFIIFIGRISDLCGLPVFVLCIMSAHIIAEAVSSLFCTEGRFFYRYKTVFAANIAPAIIAPLISLIFINYIPQYARIVGSASAAIIVAALMLLHLRHPSSSSERISAASVKYAFTASAAILPHMLAAAALTSADKLLIGKICGESDLAKYSVAHALGLVMTFATVGILGALKPWIIRKLSASEGDAVTPTVRRLFALFCILTVALTAAAPEIFRILAPREYADGLAAVYPLALAVLPMFLCNVSSSALMIDGRSWLFSILTVATAAANAVMNSVLLRHFSFVISGFVFLISYLMLCVASGGALGDKKGILSADLYGMLAAAACAVLASYLLREYIILRAFLLLALLPPLLLSVRALLRAVREK